MKNVDDLMRETLTADRLKLESVRDWKNIKNILRRINMNYIFEFSSSEIKCCEDCRFYVCGYCDEYGCEHDRYCTAEASPLTDDPDLRMDWCPLK